MSAINLNDVSQIPGDECLGDSRERINYNVDLLKEAIEELRGVVLNSGTIEFTGATRTSASAVATNTYIEVKIGGVPKYLRLYDI